MKTYPQAIHLELPEGVRCAVALSYDLEMCAGYSPDGVNHGRIMPAVQNYLFKLLDVAERYNTQLHFFYVCDGLEEENIDYLEEILRRGHVIDSHTYSHQGVAIVSPEKLDDELQRANRLLKDKLGVESTILRGPYGYKNGRESLSQANREIIVRHGFKWISGEFDDAVYDHDADFSARSASRNLPYAYSKDLIEIPFQGWSDRMWFDLRPEVDQSEIESWRAEYAHRPIPTPWSAPWPIENALDGWIESNRHTLDHAYEEGLLWVPVWHPYTHYLHDPQNRALEALLEHAASKSERVWVCTLRDAVQMLKREI
jgi:peptidoglycan/xylan/chitin deacetylase (PgdA/CDA1 family)